LPPAVQQKFDAALAQLVEQVRQDRTVLAAILCGSLSHDTVWEKSDIDLVFVTIDDSKSIQGDRTIYADGVNVHAFLVPRTKFRTLVEGTLHNSFMHSLLAKGRLLYTHDDSIIALVERLHSIGQRDTEVQLLHAGSAALASIYKAHKWFITRGDLEYTSLWILYAATALAQIEVMSRRLLVDREVIPQAMKLNPDFFTIIYADLLNSKKTRKNVEAALSAIDKYMADRAMSLFAPVIEHLRDVGEMRSCTEINDHFDKTFGTRHVTTVCEYLADQGLIGKASTAVQLTKRSTIEVQELAFYSL
jgi:predicted nucleotidyltransferase